MSAAFTQAWLIPIIPLLSFLLIGLRLIPGGRKAGAYLGTTSIAISALLACRVAIAYNGLSADAAGSFVGCSIDWLQYQPGLTATMGVLVDPISVLLLLVVTIVSLLVHIYSIGYMDDDPGINRYFAYLSLFTFSMLGLVVAPNIIQMFVFWELVGVSSFLLIGFYYQRPDAMAASKKAFIVTRFADLFFIVGILLLGFHGFQLFQGAGLAGSFGAGAQPFDFAVLNHPSVTAALVQTPAWGGFNVLTLALLLIFIGAAGKSAMFPLHVWLPDAMAGPTPVSALIHAATMVVAGVYLVARMFPAYAAAPLVLGVVGGIGAFTCLFAAVIACTQSDIKRVLAFSTLSQLGYMMFALGVASLEHPDGFSASMFHLFTHAFFKALLFLGAGSVIHAVHSNEIWEMGGLRKKMPVTHATFLIATIAIAGVWPLAGFWSKDAILLAAYDSHHMLIFATGLLVAGLTAFYMFRLYIVTFLDDNRTPGAEHAHESCKPMLIPLCVLAVLSVIAGFFPIPDFVSIASVPGEHHSSAHTLVALLSTLAAGLGIAAAFALYRQEERAAKLAQSLGGVYTLVQQKFYVDSVYTALVAFIFNYISRPFAWFDRHVVDRSMDLVADITRGIGKRCNQAQSGQVQSYGLWVLNGAVLFLLYFYLVR
jgi:NADH-quinone oxidoreductase subunit L